MALNHLQEIIGLAGQWTVGRVFGAIQRCPHAGQRNVNAVGVSRSTSASGLPQDGQTRPVRFMGWSLAPNRLERSFKWAYSWACCAVAGSGATVQALRPKQRRRETVEGRLVDYPWRPACCMAPVAARLSGLSYLGGNLARAEFHACKYALASTGYAETHTHESSRPFLRATRW